MDTNIVHGSCPPPIIEYYRRRADQRMLDPVIAEELIAAYRDRESAAHAPKLTQVLRPKKPLKHRGPAKVIPITRSRGRQ